MEIESKDPVSKGRILIVYDVSYPSIPGGGQRRLYEVGQRLAAYGFDVDWVCFDTWTPEVIAAGHSINYIGLPGYKGLYSKNGGRRYLEPVEFLVALSRASLDLSRYDVVWSGQWPILHLVVWSFKKNIASKLVVDWWEVWGRTWFSYSKLLGPIGYILETIVINRISKNSRLVAISKKSINEINIISPDSHNARLIHNGIDLENLRSISSKKRIDYDLSYIGRLKNHKNVDMLLQAIKYVEVHYDVKLTAVIVGDGPEFESLVSLSKELSIGERINFTGAVLDNMEAYSYVASSKFFVNPSTKEGGGSITLLEAFALGLPAVGFDCKDGIDKDLIGDGDRGVLVKTVSVKALGECLHDLLNCPAKIKKMSEAGVTYSKDFDWDSIASEYVDLFKEIIQDEKH